MIRHVGEGVDMADDPEKPKFDDNSTFVEHWSDPARRERYQYYAREKYEFYKAAREWTFKANIEYGKWLVGSGLAVHGGGLYALNALKDPTRPDLNAALIEAAQWNVAGLFFVLVAGFLAWLNFQYAANIYNDFANPLMVYKTDELPTGDQKRDPVGATRFGSICSGLLALWALVASAVNVFPALSAA